MCHLEPYYFGSLRRFSVSTVLPFEANENENSPFLEAGFETLYFSIAMLKIFKRHPDGMVSVGPTSVWCLTTKTTMAPPNRVVVIYGVGTKEVI